MFLFFVGRGRAEPYIIAVLATLAVVGVFALFAGAAGILELAGRGAGRNDLTKAVIDSSGEGISIVDAAGRVLYANRSYLDLTGADGPDDVRPVERLFTSDPEVSEAIYRLVQATREGNTHSEEIRIAGTQGDAGPLGAAAGAAVRQGRKAFEARDVGDRGNHARARAAGKHVSRIAARDRLSRPRAGGFLLGRPRGRHRLPQRHARGLARL